MYIWLDVYFVDELALLIKYQELMEDLQENFAILQESWHVYAVQVIVNERSFCGVWEIVNLYERSEFILPVHIIESIWSFKLKWSSHPILFAFWFLRLLVDQILCFHDSFRKWVSQRWMEIEYLRSKNAVPITKILWIIVFGYVFKLLDILESLFVYQSQSTFTFVSLTR